MDIILIFMLVIYLYIIFLSIKRVRYNKKYDRNLNIKTQGYRKWDKKGLYNRTESTPYLALEKLSKVYKINSEDHLVDFGCGKGRVLIFLYHNLNISVTGLEVNDLTFEEVLNNIKEYQDNQVNSSKNKTEVNTKNISVIKEYAQDYKIKVNQNKFFFFNPFNIEIFKKVINNIIHNADEFNKSAEIILYYPIKEYQVYLKKTPFEIIQKVRVSSSIYPREKFEIYKYEGVNLDDQEN